MESLVYQIPVQSYGDYNLNDEFDCSDIIHFINDFNFSDIGLQFGPVAGELPNYLLTADIYQKIPGMTCPVEMYAPIKAIKPIIAQRPFVFSASSI